MQELLTPPAAQQGRRLVRKRRGGMSVPSRHSFRQRKAHMLKLSSLRADLKRQHDGDWVSYPEWPGVRFNVSAFSSPGYRKASEELAKKLAKKYEDERPSDAEMHKLNGALIAEHILHDWEGIDEEYSEELAYDRLTNQEFEVLNNAVVWCARKLAQVNAEFVGQAEKNSEAPSATILRGRAMTNG
jgi:hypothetical protein